MTGISIKSEKIDLLIATDCSAAKGRTCRIAITLSIMIFTGTRCGIIQRFGRIDRLGKQK